MGVVLITVAYGKERKAGLEVLDSVFALDPAARLLEQPYGGLLLLETRLQADEAVRKIQSCSSGLVFKIVPADALIESDIEGIASEALRLVPKGASSIAVDCVRRGRRLPSSHQVEEEVGRALKARGHAIDLKHPELIVRIDIIGDRTTISVRPPSGRVVGKVGEGYG